MVQYLKKSKSLRKEVAEYFLYNLFLYSNVQIVIENQFEKIYDKRAYMWKYCGSIK